jgi:hypothetical protein
VLVMLDGVGCGEGRNGHSDNTKGSKSTHWVRDRWRG